MENEMNDYKIGTKCVQAGYTPENVTAALEALSEAGFALISQQELASI